MTELLVIAKQDGQVVHNNSIVFNVRYCYEYIKLQLTAKSKVTLRRREVNKHPE